MATHTVITAGKKNQSPKKIRIQGHVRYQGDSSKMLILAVDPGANGTGWALLNSGDGRLIEWGTIHGQSSEWDRKSIQILVQYEKLLGKHYIGQVFMESPVFMRGYGGYTTASTGDLVKLAMLCGAMFFMSSRIHGTVLVPPSSWKGQLPKKVCNNRVLKILQAQSTYQPLGRISNHALDAIGIGLWALGRF